MVERRKPLMLVKLSDEGRAIAAQDDIRGRHVVDRDGEVLGRVENLLVDTQEHRVRMLGIEHGGVLGFGATASFVPVESITRVESDTVHIDLSRDRIAEAPVYDPDVVPVPADEYLLLYSYYSLPPFWSGG